MFLFIFSIGSGRGFSFDATIDAKTRFHMIWPQCGIRHENTPKLWRQAKKERLSMFGGDASLGEKRKPPKVTGGNTLKFQEHQKLQISRFFMKETRPLYFEMYEDLCFAAPPGTIKIGFRIVFFEYGVSLCGFCIKCAVKLCVLAKYLLEALHFS